MNNDTRRIRREVIAALAQGGERQDDPIITAQHDETGRMWTGPRSQIPRRYVECSPAAAQDAALLARLLHELTAMVRGECPHLLNEDSGGNGRLSVDIDDALAREAEQEGSK